jgi:truncated hemoglobin YjbI
MSTYDLIGGKAILDEAVDAFYEKVLADPELAPFFTDTNMRRMRAMQKGFLSMALGGPVFYTGRDLYKAHEGARASGLLPNHFEKVLKILLETLETLNLPQEGLARVREVLEASKDDVLGHTGNIENPLSSANSTIVSLRDLCESATENFLEKAKNDSELRDFFVNARPFAIRTMISELVARANGDEPVYTDEDLVKQHAWLVAKGLNQNTYNLTMTYLVAALREVGVSADILTRIGITGRNLQPIIFGKERVSAGHETINISEDIATTMDEFLRLTQRGSGLTLYRGHSDAHNWILSPGLARLVNPKSKLSVGRYGSWIDLENYILTRFQRHAEPHLSSTPTSRIDWLVLGQHHGLPTRLLDWTENPLVALYFALELELGTESSVWIMEPRYVYSVDIDLERLDHIQVYFPKAIDQRIVTQKGCFTIQPLPDGCSPFIPLEDNQEVIDEGLRRLTRIIIPNDREIKAKMMSEVNRLGVDGNFIYPGLDGLSRQITIDLLADAARM